MTSITDTIDQYQSYQARNKGGGDGGKKSLA